MSNFIVEFRKLFLESPQCGSWTRASENCDYGDITTVSKDCYMCFNSGNCRNAYHSEDSKALTDCTDCAFCENCEICYECVDCDTCYNCNFCQDCNNCQNVHFSYDLRRCKDCFGCCTIRDKQYCIFNEQYSKEEYEAKMKMFDYSKAGGIKFIWQKLEEFKKKNPRMYTHQHDTADCTGDYIYHSKNCHECFDTRHTEDSGYIYQANLDIGTKDSWDCGPVPTAMDLAYDVSYSDYLFNCKYHYWCSRIKDSEYIVNCMDCENCFGCVYLKNKQKGFYILNQKVEENEYWKRTAEIKKELLENGIYTLYDLLNKDLEQGKKDELQRQNLGEATDRKCFICDGEFKIIPAEIEFYKKMKIVWPVYCPSCRAAQRYRLRPERVMYKRKCDSCHNTLISTFTEDSPCVVYCLHCWWEHIG
ncbi:MAG: hypothetical protein AAB373_02655 [Patescibacteria group bacterium]